MAVDPRAGTPARPEDLVDLDKLHCAYYDQHPDPSIVEQRVAFGTSGHRGSSLNTTFNDDHIAVTSQAICEYRAAQGTTGPLFLGRDTHALSEPAWRTAIEVFAANDVIVLVERGYTPTPSVSHAILRHNATGPKARADGVVVTPSHNPPPDGGFKYNPPDGGPADDDATGWIADRANELLTEKLAGVRRVRFERAATQRYDFLGHYVGDLPAMVNLEAIRAEGVRIGADPLGGASVAYWAAIAERHKLDLTVVNPNVDPRFGFMTLDWDGKIRMDCSSPYAMASLVSRMQDGSAEFQIATGNDADSDRHGIVTADHGLMNPNHFLAVAIGYLYRNRAGWSPGAGVGKTAVSSSMIDRVAADLGRRLVEVPVGFKWFVPGLISGAIGFGGEESAGASYLRSDGTVWTTDKDGIIMALLASEIQAVTGKSPSQHYAALTERFGAPAYARIDVATTRAGKAKLALLSPGDVRSTELAGDTITAKLTAAPGNNAPLGGLKVVTESGWFAARPSGTEDVYKVYAESFRGPEHLARIQTEAQGVVALALGGAA
jgi:phosphoglucomutase